MAWTGTPPQHKYPLGQVCELTLNGNSNLGIEHVDGKEICLKITGKAKLIVVGHLRDCDGSPLYALSDQPIAFSHANKPGSIAKTFKYRQHCKFLTFNHHEASLKKIRGQFVPIKWESIDHFIEEVYAPLLENPVL